MKIYTQTYWNKIEVNTPHVMRNIYMNSTFEKGWVIGSNRMILKSEDGGLTWDSLSAENTFPEITRLSKMVFSDNSTMWITGSLYYATGGPAGTVLQKGRLFKSVDEGVTLEEIEFEYPDPGTLPYSFLSIDFVNAQVGWLVGYNRIYKTINGGETWDQQAEFTECCEHLQFITEEIGWVSGYGKSYKTIDGGETWSELVVNSELEILHLGKIQLLNESLGWIIAQEDNFKLYKTEDGGLSFTQISSFESVIMDFHFVDNNEGWLIVYSGEIYHTINGGETWENQNEGEEEPNNRVIQVDFENGVILNPDGFIYLRDTVELTNTLENELNKELINIIPNPAKDNLTLVNMSNSTIDKIALYDLRGIRIQERKIENNSELDISLLSKGIYLIVGYTESGIMFTKKFVKS
jgi:photosystem II stability/assembly factor-like uncharacterized protein